MSEREGTPAFFYTAQSVLSNNRSFNLSERIRVACSLIATILIIPIIVITGKLTYLIRLLLKIFTDC